MIELTIKTLDSSNHHFTVDDETTVLQLKNKVLEQMGIEISLQRLIFCGRVLQDEKKLSQYGIHGKVVHLVQRAPPSPESRHTASSANPPSGDALPSNHIRQLMAVAPGALVPEDTNASTMGRMDFIRRLINDIKLTLGLLRSRLEDNNTTAASEGDAPEPEATAATENTNEERSHGPGGFEEDIPTLSARSRSVIRSGARERAHPRSLALLVDELETLHEQFAPHRATYIRLLRSNNYLRELSNPSQRQNSALTESERAGFQRTCDLVSDLMHSFAHAYHAVSEISFHVGTAPPRSRLVSEPPNLRPPFPMQAHINVVQTNRRQQNNGVNNQNAAPAAATTATAEQAQAQPIDPSAAVNGQSRMDETSYNEQTAQASANVGATAAGASGVNVSFQPDPTSYQVEIETRVPLAFALENVMISGMGHPGLIPQNLNNQAQAQQQQPQAQPQPQATTTPANNAQPSQNNQQPNNQNNQQNQNNGNRRQVLLDFDNFFGGMAQGGNLGGVEVVMSMEELPQGLNLGGFGGVGNIGIIHNPMGGALGGEGANMPWGNAPGADVLQNIVSSMIRQGLVPGVEGVAIHIPTNLGQANGNQGQANQGQANQGQANQAQVNLPQATAAQVIQTQPTQAQATTDQAQASVAQASAAQANQAQANAAQAGVAQGGQGSASSQGTAQQGPSNQSGVPPRPPLHLRRATTTTRAIALPNITYDKYLICDNIHSRRRIMRRRDEFNAQLGQMSQRRFREFRPSANNFEYLREINPSIQQEHIYTIQQLLNGPPSRETWLNALLVAISRQMSPWEPAMVPNEFHSLRMLLRNYMQTLINRSPTGNAGNAMSMVSNCFVDLHADFINRMSNYVPMRSEINIFATIQAFMRGRLPAVIAALQSDHTNETFVNRFYLVFSRIYADLCTMVWYFCLDGISSLRIVYNEFLEYLLNGIHEDAATVLRILGVENFGHMIMNVNFEENMESLLQFVQRYDDDSEESYDTSPMEVSPSSGLEESTPTDITANAALVENGSNDNAQGFNEGNGRAQLSEGRTCFCSRASPAVITRSSPASPSDSQDSSPSASQTASPPASPVASPATSQTEEKTSINTVEETASQESSQTASETTSHIAEQTPSKTVLDHAALIAGKKREAKIIKTKEEQIKSQVASETATQIAAQTAAQIAAQSAVETAAQTGVQTAAQTIAQTTAAPTVAQTAAQIAAQIAPLIVPQPREVGRVPSTSTASNAGSATSMDSRPASRPSGDRNSTRKAESPVRFVPPKLILHHWGEDWVPVFTRDHQSQPVSQEQYSDSYVAGMPARKRRCIRQSKPASTIEGFINETATEASELGSNAASNRQVRSAFREQLRNMTGARATNSRDFSPARHVHAAAFLNSSHRPDQDDSSSDSKDN